MNRLLWSINGVKFDDLNVFVSASNGILNEPKRKKLQVRSWDEMSGTQTNLSSYAVENREINLDCFLVAADYNELITKFNAFRAQFAKKGYQRLVVDLFNDKKMPFDVYLQNGLEIKKTFRQKKSIATFKLSVIEPLVNKDVYRALTNKIDITVKIKEPIHISLGDAANTVVSVSDSSKELKYTFNTKVGDLIIVSNANNIERINILNAVKVWEKI